MWRRSPWGVTRQDLHGVAQGEVGAGMANAAEQITPWLARDAGLQAAEHRPRSSRADFKVAEAALGLEQAVPEAVD